MRSHHAKHARFSARRLFESLEPRALLSSTLTADATTLMTTTTAGEINPGVSLVPEFTQLTPLSPAVVTGSSSFAPTNVSLVPSFTDLVPANIGITPTNSIGNTPTDSIGNTPTSSVGLTPTSFLGRTPTTAIGTTPLASTGPTIARTVTSPPPVLLNATTFKSLTINPVPVTAMVGNTFVGDVATLTSSQLPQNINAVHVYINWGDGTPTVLSRLTVSNGVAHVVGTHMFRIAGTFSVAVAVAPPNSPGLVNLTPLSTTTTASVALNSSTGITVTPVHGQIFSGVVGAFVPPSNLTTSVFRVSINWGDNTAPSIATLTMKPDGSILVSGTHTYASPNAYRIRISISTLANVFSQTVFSTAAVT